MISQGQTLPAVSLTQLTDDGMQTLTNETLFAGKKERDLVKQVNDELIERVIGQQVYTYVFKCTFT